MMGRDEHAAEYHPDGRRQSLTVIRQYGEWMKGRTNVWLNIYPDVGISHLRLFGSVADR